MRISLLLVGLLINIIFTNVVVTPFPKPKIKPRPKQVSVTIELEPIYRGTKN